MSRHKYWISFAVLLCVPEQTCENKKYAVIKNENLHLDKQACLNFEGLLFFFIISIIS